MTPATADGSVLAIERSLFYQITSSPRNLSAYNAMMERGREDPLVQARS